MSADSDAKLVQKLVREIAPILHGRDPTVQSAVLADLFAMWLAGHIGPDAEAHREVLIETWLKTVRALTRVYEEMILARLAEGATKQ